MNKCCICENSSLLEICDSCNQKSTKAMTKLLRKELAESKGDMHIFMGIDSQYYMASENFFPGAKSTSYCHWLWWNDKTLINASAGVLLVSQAQWDIHATEFKDLYQPVGTRHGFIGYGLVVSNILHLYLV